MPAAVPAPTAQAVLCTASNPAAAAPPAAMIVVHRRGLPSPGADELPALLMKTFTPSYRTRPEHLGHHQCISPRRVGPGQARGAPNLLRDRRRYRLAPWPANNPAPPTLR